MPIDEKITGVRLVDADQSGAVVLITADANRWKVHLSTGDRELDATRTFESLDVAKRWGALALDVGNQQRDLSHRYRAKLAEIRAQLDEPLGEPAPDTAPTPRERTRSRQAGRR